jgi:hypothetical protein
VHPVPARGRIQPAVPRAVLALGVASVSIAFLTVVNGDPAFANSWAKTSLPNVSDRPEDPDLDGSAPYTLRWPAEGTTDSGSNDCDPTPPWKTGRRVRSDLLTGVKGILKRGEFWKAGSDTSVDGGNHLAVFFHQEQCYGGGAEYGFTRKLNEGNATLYFFQCWNCNTGDELYTRKAVWSFAGSDRIYRIIVQADGDFVVKVHKFASGGGLELVHAETVSKASWLPNLYGVNGYITANAHTGDSATADSYIGSYNQLDTVKYLH